MAQVTLKADTGRLIGTRSSRRLRKEGLVPAVVYGQGSEPTHVAVDHHDLSLAFHSGAGANVVINLEIDGKTGVPTLVREIDHHPYKPFIRHVDFVMVNLKVKVHAEVALHYVGTPVGVKEGDGVLTPARNSITVEALPTEIPNAIEVDVSGLNINDSLRIADLAAIDNVEILDDPDELLVSVSVLAAEPEPEVEEGEGEDGAEGEAGAEGEGVTPADAEDSGSGEG